MESKRPLSDEEAIRRIQAIEDAAMRGEGDYFRSIPAAVARTRGRFFVFLGVTAVGAIALGELCKAMSRVQPNAAYALLLIMTAVWVFFSPVLMKVKGDKQATVAYIVLCPAIAFLLIFGYAVVRGV